MLEVTKAIPVGKMIDVGETVGKGLGEAIKKNPKESLAIALVLGSLYILKDKKIKFKLKRKDVDIEFETE